MRSQLTARLSSQGGAGFQGVSCSMTTGGRAASTALVRRLLSEIPRPCRHIASNALDENTRSGTVELSEESTLHRGVEILAIFTLIFSTETASAQVGAVDPSSARCTTELARATLAEGSVVDRSVPARAVEIRFEPRGLSLLRPYAPGKVPVVLVNGLWGSPRQWCRMVKDLEADPFVSERFQFLTFGYSTGDPIPYSAHMLRRAIGDLRDRLDPDRSNPAWNRMVLIGHSMGGLLCKMMIQDSGSKLWDLMTGSPVENLAGPAKARELLYGSMVFKPMAEVRRVIFITTPHRGSPLVWGPIRDVGTRLMRPPTPLKQVRTSILASNGPAAFTRTFREGLATSIDELAWEHPLLLAIDGLPINPNVKRHSIIAEQRYGTVRPGGGDGQVPYASAHHPGAVSELIVHAGHYCLEDSRVIDEVARILKEHATPRPYARERTDAIVSANLAIAPHLKINFSNWSGRS